MKQKLTNEQAMQYRKLFRSYHKMIFEIKALKNSINFLEKNKQSELTQDIYAASVSHASGETIGYNPNISVDKIPNIVATIDQMAKQQNDDISRLKYKRNVFELVIKTIDDFLSCLPIKKREIISLFLIEDKGLVYTAKQTGYCDRQIVNITNAVLFDFSSSVNFDTDMVFELLA